MVEFVVVVAAVAVAVAAAVVVMPSRSYLSQRGPCEDEYQIEQEDKSLQHGDETKPIENPEAHIKKYRESVMIMKQSSTLARSSSKYNMDFCCSLHRFLSQKAESDSR